MEKVTGSRSRVPENFLKYKKMKYTEEVGKGSGGGAAQKKVSGRGQKWPGQSRLRGAKLEDRGGGRRCFT